MIEELRAENGKEGVPKPILAKIAALNGKLARAESDNKITNKMNREFTKEIDMMNHEIERLMAEESTKSDAANLQTAIVKKELSDLEISMKEVKEKLATESSKAKAANAEAKKAKNELSEMKKRTKKENEKGMEANEALKETSKLEKKLEEVIKSLEEETEAKERGWEIMDLLNQEKDALEEEKRSLIKRLAEEIEKNDTLKEVDHTVSLATSTPIKLDPTEDSGLEHSLMPEQLETSSKQGAMKLDLAENGLFLKHPTHNTGLMWGKNRELRNEVDLDDQEYPGGVAACASCHRKLLPSNCNPMGSFIPMFSDYHSFDLANFLDSCNAPWLHYGYCHNCLHEARLKDEQKVLEHAKNCGALEQVYGDCSDAIRSACIFYAETENAIRHGSDEHRAYNLIRQRLSECAAERRVFVPDMAYREALWKLKKCDHEEKEDREENQGNEEGKENSDTLESEKESENEAASENEGVMEELSDSPEPLWYLAMLEREGRGVMSDYDEHFAEELAGEPSETSDEEAIPPSSSNHH
jgi:hypothetical protein